MFDKYTLRRTSGELSGPYSKKTLLAMIVDGAIQPDDVIRSSPDGKWIRVDAAIAIDLPSEAPQAATSPAKTTPTNDPTDPYMQRVNPPSPPRTRGGFHTTPSSSLGRITFLLLFLIIAAVGNNLLDQTLGPMISGFHIATYGFQTPEMMATSVSVADSSTYFAMGRWWYLAFFAFRLSIAWLFHWRAVSVRFSPSWAIVAFFPLFFFTILAALTLAVPAVVDRKKSEPSC